MTAIVLVPGLLCTSEVFAPQIPALWPHGPITVASTLCGRTIPQIAAAILDTAPRRFALAGISMGGYISLELMRQAPERVAKLALLNTTAYPDTPEQSLQRRSLMSEARAHGLEKLVARTAAALRHPSRRDDEALLKITLRMASSIGIDGFIRQTQAIIDRPDARPVLPTITAPTLVLTGDHDPLMPPSLAREMVEVIPHSRTVIVANCGHGSTLEQPDAVSAALVQWLVDL